MTQIKLYHGTSFESFQDILANGFDGYLNSNWYCSSSDVTYFYNPLQMLNKEFDNIDECQNDAIERAFENGRIAAAKQRSLSNKIIVIELTIDEEYINLDDSCPNMDYACYTHNEDIKKHGKISQIFEADFLPSMSLVYLAGCLDNEYFNSDNLTALERSVLSTLSLSELYLDDLFMIEYWDASSDYIILENTN